MKNYLTQFSSPFRFINSIRNVVLKLKYKKLLIGCESHLTDVTFENFVALGTNVQLNNSSVGKHSYISSNSLIRNTKIGRFCSIGPNVKIGLGKHPTLEFISTHPVFYSLKKQSGTTYSKEQYFAEEDTVNIGHDVWIGASAIIMDGLNIANGAIVAAGAVVTRDVAPFEIVGGVPAKQIRFRFSQDEIQAIEKSEWWNQDEAWLKENAALFLNKQDFFQSATHK